MQPTILYLRGRWHVLFKGDDVTSHLPSSSSSLASARGAEGGGVGRGAMRIALSFGAEIYRGPRGVPLREILKIQKFLRARARTAVY